jgi:hypothetical protein
MPGYTRKIHNPVEPPGHVHTVIAGSLLPRGPKADAAISTAHARHPVAQRSMDFPFPKAEKAGRMGAAYGDEVLA